MPINLMRILGSVSVFSFECRKGTVPNDRAAESRLLHSEDAKSWCLSRTRKSQEVTLFSNM